MTESSASDAFTDRTIGARRAHTIRRRDAAAGRRIAVFQNGDAGSIVYPVTPLYSLVALLALLPPRQSRMPHDSDNVFVVGRAERTLGGPWRFRAGDDTVWASPSYDDRTWETVSLAAPPGAHDGDVGLTGYVPGWSARGHPGYAGFAWYRIRVRLSGDTDSLAIAGPPYVEDAYQLFVNGKLLGGIGDFRGGTPSAYSTTPLLLRLPRGSDLVIALRVWMAPENAGGAPDAGGVHIAPAIGALPAVSARVRVQWIELIRGYFLEILQAGVFVALALAALGLGRLSGERAYGWIAAGLFATAAMRALLAVAAWTSWLSNRRFDLAENALVIPAMICAWCLAWWAFNDGRPRGLWKAIVAATALHVVGRVLLNGAVLGGSSSATSIITPAIEVIRLVLLVAYVTSVLGLVHARRPHWELVTVIALLIGVGLFASELSALGISGIWFPYGTGVSRTQFAYAAADVMLSIWLWLRLRDQPSGAPAR